MYVATEVPERYLANVTKNKEVNIEFPVLGLQVKSVVGQVANFINPSNRSFEIEIPVTNKEGSIKPNLTAKLHINDYTNNNAILIPQSIISENSKGEQFVYVVKNKNANKEAVAERVVIVTGKTQGDMIEVLANLPVGTEVVEEGARSVNNGQTVRVINK
jgi:multidrug efflux pump subunit AcrA (membrane-fusion protein)